MQYNLIVVRDARNNLDVFVVGGDIEDNKKEMSEQGEEIVAFHKLEGSLLALGILVSDSLERKDSFGSQIEKMLTTIVRDVVKIAKQ